MFKLLLFVALVALIAAVTVDAQYYYGAVPSWGGYSWGGAAPVYSGWTGGAGWTGYAAPGYLLRK